MFNGDDFKGLIIRGGLPSHLIKQSEHTWDEVGIGQADIERTDEDLVSQRVQSTTQSRLLTRPIACDPAIQLSIYTQQAANTGNVHEMHQAYSVVEYQPSIF